MSCPHLLEAVLLDLYITRMQAQLSRLVSYSTKLTPLNTFWCSQKATSSAPIFFFLKKTHTRCTKNTWATQPDDTHHDIRRFSLYPYNCLFVQTRRLPAGLSSPHAPHGSIGSLYATKKWCPPIPC